MIFNSLLTPTTTVTSNRQLILASQSPRRRALLEDAGYRFQVIPADDEAESSVDVAGLVPIRLVQRLAEVKAANVANKVNGQVRRPWTIIAADTVADLQGRVLGKPTDRDDARRMLESLNGRIHEVHTGVSLLTDDGKQLTECSTTQLKMDSLTSGQIEEYLETDKWSGKAGAFGYQDGWDWLHVIKGEESNVVGLPLKSLASMLRRIES